jgi:hypothetical protein
MVSGTRFVAASAFSTLAARAGCGGGSGRQRPTPPPTGGFTNSSLNGTYTFSVAGADSAGIFTMAGSFVACGCSQGTISSGMVDVTNPSGIFPASTLASNSSYHITPDGRGVARLFITTTSSGSLGEIDIDFVLSSPSHGLVIRFDASGTGSGSIDQQPSAVTQATLSATPYAFSLSGGDLNNSPVTMVGAFTVDGSGNITTGVEDFNNHGAVLSQQALSGSVTVGSGTAPGQAILTTSSGSRSFSVYPIDATHLKLIENDGLAVLMGDAFNQPTASIAAGTLVFTLTGLDTNNPADLFATAGFMTSDGNGLLTDGSEDVNDAGLVDNNTNPATPFAFSGTFSYTGGGRYQVTLSNYVGGSAFAAYPSSAGLLMLQIDNTAGGITAGVAVAQLPGGGITASQGYALNLTGEDLSTGSEIDQIAELKTSTTTLTGLTDQNDGGSAFTQNVNGTYNFSNGFGSATFTSGLPNLFLYPVDSSTTFFITADPTIAAVGSLQLQAAPAGAAAQASRRQSVVPLQRVLPHAHSQNRLSRPKAN